MRRKKPKDKRWHLSLQPPPDAGPGPALKPAAAPTASTPSGKTASPAPASAATPGTTTVPGKVSTAGPSPTDTLSTAYDIEGRPVGLVARNANTGITTENYKLTVGAASCTVVITPTGVRLIDAGVRHDGVIDPEMVDYAMKRLHEIIGDRPIEEILITHSHLDHVGILDRISGEFVIKQISVNAIQLVDLQFLKSVKNTSEKQRAQREAARGEVPRPARGMER